MPTHELPLRRRESATPLSTRLLRTLPPTLSAAARRLSRLLDDAPTDPYAFTNVPDPFFLALTPQEVTADESHEIVAAFSMTVMITLLLLVIILGATIKHYNIQWLHQSLSLIHI